MVTQRLVIAFVFFLFSLCQCRPLMDGPVTRHTPDTNEPYPVPAFLDFAVIENFFTQVSSFFEDIFGQLKAWRWPWEQVEGNGYHVLQDGLDWDHSGNSFEEPSMDSGFWSPDSGTPRGSGGNSKTNSRFLSNSYSSGSDSDQ